MVELYYKVTIGSNPRRTMMTSFSKRRFAEQRLSDRGLDQYSDQPYFLHPEYLRGVRSSTREFFAGEGFAGLYAGLWRAKLVEHMKYKVLTLNL